MLKGKILTNQSDDFDVESRFCSTIHSENDLFPEVMEILERTEPPQKEVKPRKVQESERESSDERKTLDIRMAGTSMQVKRKLRNILKKNTMSLPL